MPLLPCPDCGGPKYRYSIRCRKCSDAGGHGRIYSVHPVREPTEAEIAWVAGLYEGEGSVRFHGASFVLVIPQQDPEILYRCQPIYGGTLNGPRSNGMHYWQAHGRQASKLANDIYPWLSARRRAQIDVAWPQHMRDEVANAI